VSELWLGFRLGWVRGVGQHVDTTAHISISVLICCVNKPAAAAVFDGTKLVESLLKEACGRTLL